MESTATLTYKSIESTKKYLQLLYKMYFVSQGLRFLQKIFGNIKIECIEIEIVKALNLNSRDSFCEAFLFYKIILRLIASITDIPFE